MSWARGDAGCHYFCFCCGCHWDLCYLIFINYLLSGSFSLHWFSTLTAFSFILLQNAGGRWQVWFAPPSKQRPRYWVGWRTRILINSTRKTIWVMNNEKAGNGYLHMQMSVARKHIEQETEVDLGCKHLLAMFSSCLGSFSKAVL